MLRAFLLLSVLLLHCAGTKNGAIVKEVVNDKNVFFAMSKFEGYSFLKQYGLTLCKLDSSNESFEKVYIFYYKEE